MPAVRPGERRGYAEPRRVAPRLAVYARETPDRRRISGRRLRSLAAQLRACRRATGLLRGQHDDLDVFVDNAGAVAPEWDVLLGAVAEGMYDGVVVDSLSVVITDYVQAIELRRLMLWSGCELYVAGDQTLGLSDAKGIAFCGAVERLCSEAEGVSFTDASTGIEAGQDAGVHGAGSSRPGIMQSEESELLLLARLSRVMDQLLESGNDPYRALALSVRKARIVSALRRLRIETLRHQGAGGRSEGDADGDADVSTDT